jgi:hypothetical protein
MVVKSKKPSKRSEWKTYDIDLRPFAPYLKGEDVYLLPILTGKIRASSKYHALSMFLHTRRDDFINNGRVFYRILVDKIDKYVREVGVAAGPVAVLEAPKPEPETDRYFMMQLIADAETRDKSTGRKDRRNAALNREILAGLINLPYAEIKIMFLKLYEPGRIKLPGQIELFPEGRYEKQAFF